MANLAIFYGLRQAPGSAERGWGEPWTRWGWLQAAGFAVLVGGTACYARGDLLQERQLRAKARWARLRASLRDLVEAARAEEPLRPARIAGPARVRSAALQVLVLAALEAEVRRRHLATAGIGSHDGMEHIERPMRGRWGCFSRYSDLRLAFAGSGGQPGQRPGALGSLRPGQARGQAL